MSNVSALRDIRLFTTGAEWIVQGSTITVKGTAKCVMETFDTAHPENDPTTEDSPESITEVAVRLGHSGTFVKANPTGPVSGSRRSGDQRAMTLAATAERVKGKDKL